jgi:hypothetical protein
MSVTFGRKMKFIIHPSKTTSKRFKNFFEGKKRRNSLFIHSIQNYAQTFYTFLGKITIIKIFLIHPSKKLYPNVFFLATLEPPNDGQTQEKPPRPQNPRDVLFLPRAPMV